MKFNIFYFFLIGFLSLTFFFGCKNDDKIIRKTDSKPNETKPTSPTIINYTVIFDTDYGTDIPSQTVKSGTIINLVSPVKTGCIFDGWFKDEKMTKPFVAANEKITASMTIYAKWKTLFEFETNELGDGVQIVNFNELQHQDIVIPISINRKKVVGILGSVRNGVVTPNPIIKSVSLPEGLKSLGNYAFAGCSNLSSIKIPLSVTSIGSFAFKECQQLTSIDIPSSVLSIGYASFSNCTMLQSISIPSGISNIGNALFSGCSVLTSVTINATRPPTFGSNVFDYTPSSMKIYVPKNPINVLNDYKIANGWKIFATQIEAQP
ncbi:MAG: leucine-rich repeat protein [Sphingobacteriaceae bacterium]|nr:leucine-rich repeat protein [Sphingobacteriaceae bacterium]